MEYPSDYDVDSGMTHQPTPPELSPYDRFRTAELLFDQRRFTQAAAELESLLTALGEPTANGDLPAYEMGAVRTLLARAYYHSAQLGRAESATRALVEVDPTDGYAALLLGRTLARQSRHDEAAGWLRRAEALGVTL